MNFKYPEIIDLITNGCQRNLFRRDDIDNIYNEVIGEYEDMGDNPADATFQDIVEIADASGYQIPSDK